ncbi:MAG: MFS transporter [Planctomycetaceae bacterium]|nr:MFS transporter [Planctomycetaceae bacterium]
MGSLSWRDYYVVLCVPAVIIAFLLGTTLRENRTEKPPSPKPSESNPSPASEQERIPGIFYFLVLIGALSGFVYAGFMHFLPRYLDSSLNQFFSIPDAGLRNYLAALVLGCGVIGQAVAGRFARPGVMERQLSLVILANVPCLIAMALAEGPWRLVAACLFATVHFMNQPLYNSLIAQYVPSHRRSVGYGFSNMMCFGIGALGPLFAGLMPTNQLTYCGLAGVIFFAAMFAWALSRRPSYGHSVDEPA